MALIIILVCVVMALAGKMSGMPRLNPLSVLAIAWVPLAILAAWPGVISPQLNWTAWAILTLGVISIAIGAISGWHLPRHKIRNTVILSSPNNLTKIHYLACIALIGFVAFEFAQSWPIIEALGGFKALFSAESALGNEYKLQFTLLREANQSEGISSGGLLFSIIGYSLFLGHIGLFTGSLLWNNGKFFTALLPLIIIGVHSILTFQRTSFIMGLIIFGFSAYLFKRSIIVSTSKKIKNSKRISLNKIFTIVSISVITLSILLIPLQLRNGAATGKSTGAQSLAEYLVASIAGLGGRVSNDGSILIPSDQYLGQAVPSQGLGAYTFTGLYGILGRFGIDVPQAPHSLDYIDTFLFGERFTSNTATAFYDYYLDFGWPGLVLMSFGLGALCAVAFRKVCQGEVAWLPLASVLLTSILWTFFVNSLLGDFRYIYLVFFAAPIVKKFLTYRKIV